jgi:hypothetical protein
MLASDLNNRDFAGARNPDDLLNVTFYKSSEQNNYETEKQGRPIFVEKDMVRIQIAGRNDLTIESEVRNEHKIRFPRQWQAFLLKYETHTQAIGTPVEEWPAITRSEAEELKGLKFYTVEQVAAASDMQAQRMGMNAPVLIQKAKAFLEQARDTAFTQKQAAELARKDQEIAELKANQDRLAKQMEQLMKDKGEKPKRKYTKKQDVVPETNQDAPQ